MKLLPYENFYIITKLKPEEVVETLKEVISPDSGYIISARGFLNPTGPNTPFKGYVNYNGFKFKPNAYHNIPFLPQINGSIEPYGEGCRVHVKMRLYVFIMIIMGIMISVAGFFCVKFFPHLISNRHAETDIIPFFIFLLFYLFVMGGFKFESISSKSFLKELLEDERL